MKWFSDGVYGVKNASSRYYMAELYGLAIAIYVISRVVGGAQGMDLGLAYGEIPAE